jgi:hypothetical protein
VRAAISALRSLGLRNLIVTTATGYTLQARITLVADRAAASAAE